MSDEPPEDVLQRLDPDRAVQARESAQPPASTPPEQEAFNPRRYQWLAGVFALVLVIGFSISQFSSHGIGTAGIPAGHVLPAFAAPLAGSTLVGDANLHPPCTEADHDPRALNTCLDVKHGPLVLDFFVTGSSACEKAVDAMQAIAPRFRAAGVQFAAIAVRSGPGPVRTLIRKHGWTIPVAYDRDGGVGQTDGVVVCPLLELVRRGGVVAQRLIGKHWAIPTDLAAPVGRLAAGG